VSNERPHLGQLNLAAQGDFKRVLFVCSGGMLRSATAAQWAAATLDWNTRNCGTMDCALPPPHANVLEWAEVIYCMEQRHLDALAEQFPWAREKMLVLDIPDVFEYRNPHLIELLQQYFEAQLGKMP
jgi:predicted protein tyrosine phosphatase